MLRILAGLNFDMDFYLDSKKYADRAEQTTTLRFKFAIND